MVKEKTDRETTEEFGQQEGSVKKKRLPKLVLLIILLLIIGGGTGGFFLFGKQVMAKYMGERTEGQTGQEGTQKIDVVGPILQLEPFVFNLTGDQSRYARVILCVEVKDSKVMEEATKMTPIIRDRILSIFGTKTAEALMDMEQREGIKKEVSASLQPLFKAGEGLKAVYITDIIIQ